MQKMQYECKKICREHVKDDLESPTGIPKIPPATTSSKARGDYINIFVLVAITHDKRRIL